jgi:hypothetical protein
MVSNLEPDYDPDSEPDPEVLAVRPAVRGRPKPRLLAVVVYCILINVEIPRLSSCAPSELG